MNFSGEGYSFRIWIVSNSAILHFDTKGNKICILGCVENFILHNVIPAYAGMTSFGEFFKFSQDL